MARSQSVNEYNLGYGTQVEPVFQPESPPPPETTYISDAELDHLTPNWTWPSPLYRMGRSVDCDLPQHVAEKFRKHLLSSAERAQDISNSPREETNLLMPIIPTISIEEDVDEEGPRNRRIRRQPSLYSVASFSASEVSSTTFSIDKSHFVTSRIQLLVSAFTDRAKSLKERIAQPPTPSTDASAKEERGEAPSPPPLQVRHDLPSDSEEIKKKLIKISFHIPSTFHPQSPCYIVWLFVMSLAFMYNLWGVPLRVTFPYQDALNVHQWMITDYVTDVIYLIDTFYVRPRLRFVREGIWVEDIIECRKNYISSLGSKIDVLSLTPLDLLYFYFGIESSLLRFPRMIRILPFWECFDRLDMMVPFPFIIRIGRTFFYMLYLIHLNACAYFSYSEWAGLGSDTFVFQGEGNAYLRCFYFAMKTATKIGKNPKPVDNIDRTFMIFNWLIGVFACAAIIGQIRDIMAAAERNKTEYRERLDRTVQFMYRLNLPPKIQNRVRMWFTYNWSMQKTLDEKSSLISLPHNMQMDIAMNVHAQTLSKVQLFQDCDPALIRDLVLKLKPVLFLPGDLVCKKGEVGKEMYIVKTGQVQVMGGPNNDIVLVTLSEGSVFGEISLLAVGGGNRRMADVRSQGFSNLFVLSKSDLNEALEYHPEAQKILQRKAKKLVKKSSQQHLPTQPIITAKPPTPKLVKTVLQAVPQYSKARELLLHGSRASSLNPEDQQSEHKNPSTNITHSDPSCSSSDVATVSKDIKDRLTKIETRIPLNEDELLLKPSSLEVKEQKTSNKFKNTFKIPPNKITPDSCLPPQNFTFKP